MISTRDLSGLPDITRLKRLMQSLAILDAILSPEWQYRYHSFNSHWATTEQMGSMRNGGGDDLFVVFGPAGCFAKGFAHEAPMAFPPGGAGTAVWPGVLDAVPVEFESSLNEPAFKMEDVTFCIWRRPLDAGWQRGDVTYPSGEDPDGSEYLLSPYDGSPDTYREWAEGYFEVPVDLATVRAVYQHEPLTQELVQRLNPELALETLAEDLAEIGYPIV